MWHSCLPPKYRLDSSSHIAPYILCFLPTQENHVDWLNHKKKSVVIIRNSSFFYKKKNNCTFKLVFHFEAVGKTGDNLGRHNFNHPHKTSSPSFTCITFTHNYKPDTSLSWQGLQCPQKSLTKSNSGKRVIKNYY